MQLQLTLIQGLSSDLVSQATRPSYILVTCSHVYLLLMLDVDHLISRPYVWFGSKEDEHRFQSRKRGMSQFPFVPVDLPRRIQDRAWRVSLRFEYEAWSATSCYNNIGLSGRMPDNHLSDRDGHWL
jgi:hypothetical protein